MSDKDLQETGRCAFAAIEEMVAELHTAREDEDYKREDEARQVIEEDPLSLEVRTGWYVPSGEIQPAEEYCLLLTTGGPAVRIVGELDGDQPISARLDVQDWFTPWTEYTGGDEEVLLEYVSCFYFGEV